MPDAQLTEQADLPKVEVRAAPDGGLATALGVPYGRAMRDSRGVLVVGTTPEGWLLLAPDGRAPSMVRTVEDLAGREFVTAVDVSHGYACFQITGHAARSVLAKLCAIDLTDRAMPDGTAFRSLLAGITATVVREDKDGELSYLVLCERSYGQYIADVLVDAGSRQAG